MRQIKLTEETKKDILTTLLKRSPSQYPEYEKTVSEILNNVRNNGDKAVFEYTEKRSWAASERRLLNRHWLNIQKNLTDINMMKIL